VSTTDASCMGLAMTLPSGWERVGMGYSSNAVGSTSETLYIARIGGTTGIGAVDITKSSVTPIGTFTGPLAGESAELTGTGDSRLFGFFTTSPVQVAEISKQTGAPLTGVPMTGVVTPLDWAFSFWGGHFYLYTSVGAGSSVTDYDPMSGTINPSYVTGLDFDIVGAGVSTCAPLMPPQ
jgi:hypothetical protein